MKTGYLVADIMTTKPVTVSSDTTVQECAAAMKQSDVGSVLVMERDEIKGILTEKDIIFKVTIDNADNSKVTAKEIMTSKDKMTSISPEKDIYDALIVMKENLVRRLPVLEGDDLKGLITINDILKIEPDLFDIMVEKISLREETRKLNVEGYDVTKDEDEP